MFEYLIKRQFGLLFFGIGRRRKRYIIDRKGNKGVSFFERAFSNRKKRFKNVINAFFLLGIIEKYEKIKTFFDLPIAKIKKVCYNKPVLS